MTTKILQNEEYLVPCGETLIADGEGFQFI